LSTMWFKTRKEKSEMNERETVCWEETWDNQMFSAS
jgi:hypothetical protein